MTSGTRVHKTLRRIDCPRRQGCLGLERPRGKALEADPTVLPQRSLIFQSRTRERVLANAQRYSSCKASNAADPGHNVSHAMSTRGVSGVRFIS
jgi:hypothetical protein